MEQRSSSDSDLAEFHDSSQHSHRSSHSILSRHLAGPAAIRPSTVRSRDKTVVFWTPVVTDGQFVSAVKKVKLKYNNTRPLHNQAIPDLSMLPEQQSHIIKLPKSDAHEYLEDTLEFDFLMTDNQLLQFLNAYIQRPSIQKHHEQRFKDAEPQSRIDSILDCSPIVHTALAEGNDALVQELRAALLRQLVPALGTEKPFAFLKYRRDAKHKAKMFRMVQMYFEDKLKPRQIAKQLDLCSRFVSDHVYLVKQKLKKL